MILCFNRTHYDNLEYDELDGASGTLCIFIQKSLYYRSSRAGVAHLLEALRYKPEDRRFDFPIMSLEFFIDIILPAALWSWVRFSY